MLRHHQKEIVVHVENSVIAIFARLDSAEAAVNKLIAGGLDKKNVSVVGQGYHADKQACGFYTGGDDIQFWGAAVSCGVSSGPFFRAAHFSQCLLSATLWCLDFLRPR